MVSRNEKSMMKLVRMPILRLLLLKREMLIMKVWKFENVKGFVWLGGKPCNPGKQIL